MKGLKAKTIKLVTKVLSDDKKRKLYSPGEIAYMERQVYLMRLERQRRKHQRKLEKGFGHSE